MIEAMNRRSFLQALALSVLAAGAPLPVGMPREAREKQYWYETLSDDGSPGGFMQANHPYHLHPDAVPTRRLTRQEFNILVRQFEEGAYG